MLPRLTRFESHSLFWIVLILVFSVFYGISPENNNVFVLIADHSFSLPLYLAISYTIAYIFIPFFLFEGKYLLFFLGTLILISAFSFLEVLKTTYVSMPLLYPERVHSLSLKFYDISRAAFYLVLPAIFFNTVKYLENWYKLKVVKNELEKETLKNELKILKSQLQPAFLINTLQSLKEKAEQNPNNAADGIEKVSELLSFILYEFNTGFISFNKEIRLVNNYISLFSMNSYVRIETSFCLQGAEHRRIVPLVLFSLVEYVFKNLTNVTDKTRVRFFADASANQIDFWAECTDSPAIVKNFKKDRIIQNLERTLKLSYHKDYCLETQQQSNKYMLHLNIINA